MQSPPRNSLFVHVAVLFLVAVGYILIRGIWAPVTGFWRWHATDLLAGVALPSLFGLAARLLPAGQADAFLTLRGKLLLTAAAVLVWEGVVPLFSERSTADWIDVLCYFAGTLLQHSLLLRRSKKG